ncbi:type-F conjugative transfer system pilin acetylase TraX [Escherichia coli]|nr:type-F conjugative transfer system pilin acetylase TraX [Escherichia coli]HCB7597292.1 type-F conjugative transfer system pilin acetylase TraX [Escherichia coli]HCB8874451.1 type-F conjugative transfer system pilin acetylase TraX [Escherichia coli]
MTTDNTNTTRNDSLAARTGTWLQSLLVWSPGQRDIIKTVALVLMVLDHANRILHLEQTWMFLAGRGAFPLFALVWGLNLSRYEHIRQASVNRLWGWAVVAQFGYFLAGYPWYEGNILFAFAVAAQMLKWCEYHSLVWSVSALTLLVLWFPLSSTSYGVVGIILLMLCHRIYRTTHLSVRSMLALCLFPVVALVNLQDGVTAAVSGVLVTYMVVRMVSGIRWPAARFWPADFFPVFYVCHLAVLGVMAL